MVEQKLNFEMWYPLNYEKMKKDNQPFAEELIKYVFKPSRLTNLSNTFNIDLDEYVELIN